MLNKMKQGIGIISLIAILLISGCTVTENKEDSTKSENILEENDNTQEKINDNTKNTYSMAKISSHNSKEDCWLLINNKVYDVTSFISSHPGGSAILQGCGKDATELYETRPMGSGTPHSSNARDMLKEYYIGDLE